MKQLTENQKLDEMIGLLQQKQQSQLTDLKLQYQVTYDSYKPINILKSNLLELKKTPNIAENIVPTLLGIAGGFISNKVISSTSSNPIVKVLGTVVQYLVSNFITKKTENNLETK